jgi:hypothetical protein
VKHLLKKGALSEKVCTDAKRKEMEHEEIQQAPNQEAR